MFVTPSPVEIWGSSTRHRCRQPLNDWHTHKVGIIEVAIGNTDRSHFNRDDAPIKNYRGIPCETTMFVAEDPRGSCVATAQFLSRTAVFESCVCIFTFD